MEAESHSPGSIVRSVEERDRIAGSSHPNLNDLRPVKPRNLTTAGGISVSKKPLLKSRAEKKYGLGGVSFKSGKALAQSRSHQKVDATSPGGTSFLRENVCSY